MKQWQQEAIKLKEQGYSGRAIARILGRSKSSVNDFFCKYRESSERVYPIPQNLSYTTRDEGLKIAVVADTQCKPGVDLSYMTAIGNYLADKKPDVIVHIGDAIDFPSLSSYDKGKLSFEGRRLKEDIQAGIEGLYAMLDPVYKAISEDSSYSPRLVFCIGNHEDRFDRLARDMPELEGFVGIETLGLEKMGWEVYPYLKPCVVEGVNFVHYLANPFTGKPYGGSALSQLKNVGVSFVVGHKQILDVAMLPTLDGKMRIGLINGACYDFDEGYKGYQNNNHFRGLTMLHEVKDGFALPMFVSLDFMKRKYLQYDL